MHIEDISSSGQLLVEQGIARRGIVLSTHGSSERDLSWLDFGYLRDISRDGKTILFEEEGRESQNYQIFMRDVDGSPAIPIGEGYGLAISPDKRWALGQKLARPVDEMWLLPVGPGQARRLTPPNLAPYVGATFLSDSKRVVYIGAETGHRVRAWLQDIDGGPPRPLTPEGLGGFVVSPDDKWVIVGERIIAGDYRKISLLSLENGTKQDVQGMKPNEIVLGSSQRRPVLRRLTQWQLQFDPHRQGESVFRSPRGMAGSRYSANRGRSAGPSDHHRGRHCLRIRLSSAAFGTFTPSAACIEIELIRCNLHALRPRFQIRRQLPMEQMFARFAAR